MLEASVIAKQRVILVEERPNPSSDYFVRARFPMADFEVITVASPIGLSASVVQDAILVLVRYVRFAWRKPLQMIKPQLKQLIYFMDDDLLDWRAYRQQSLRYQYKLFTGATFHRHWIAMHAHAIWVSTPYLAEKYHRFNAVLLEPRPWLVPQRFVRVFYHGSASHHAEVLWLLPIIQQVVQRHPQIVFELIGDGQVAKWFRNVPRVEVVHPMSWPTYQAFIQQPGRDIGLVPLLDTSFNRARSHTKVFDIAAAGAVGLYAQQSECATFFLGQCEEKAMQPGVDGVVLPMEPTLWRDKILELADQRLLA